jgi:proteasome assembly chaperone (PAC2) family protein
MERNTMVDEGSSLQIYEMFEFNKPRLLLSFSGWMDGGEVSTGTIRCLVEKLEARDFASIDPRGFYLYNVPGMMEVASMFRPHVKIEEGLIDSFAFPSNIFYYSPACNLILFLGKEPNMQWEMFSDCIFTLCTVCDVQSIYFIGSVSSLVPHTREPRLLCSASNAQELKRFQHYGVKLANYEGPASIVTYLTHCCKESDLDMVSLVATIPAYVQGSNPKCIEAVTRRLAGMLDLKLDLTDVRAVSEEFEHKLGELVREQPELAENIVKLEEDYDNDIFNNEMGELRRWLQRKGIRLD